MTRTGCSSSSHRVAQDLVATAARFEPIASLVGGSAIAPARARITGPPIRLPEGEDVARGGVHELWLDLSQRHGAALPVVELRRVVPPLRSTAHPRCSASARRRRRSHLTSPARLDDGAFPAPPGGRAAVSRLGGGCGPRGRLRRRAGMAGDHRGRRRRAAPRARGAPPGMGHPGAIRQARGSADPDVVVRAPEARAPTGLRNLRAGRAAESR
jgi:hypothetical protein